jgi:hypothetical protein
MNIVWLILQLKIPTEMENVKNGNIRNRFFFPLLKMYEDTNCRASLIFVNIILAIWHYHYLPGVYKRQRSRPTKGQNRPNKMGKIEFKF